VKRQFIVLLSAISALLILAGCGDGFGGKRFHYRTPQEAWKACNRGVATRHTFFVGEKFCYQKPILYREKIDKKDQYISLVLIDNNDFSERYVLDRYYYGELDRDFVYELQLLDYPDPLDPPARRR